MRTVVLWVQTFAQQTITDAVGFSRPMLPTALRLLVGPARSVFECSRYARGMVPALRRFVGGDQVLIGDVSVEQRFNQQPGRRAQRAPALSEPVRLPDLVADVALHSLTRHSHLNSLPGWCSRNDSRNSSLATSSMMSFFPFTRSLWVW